MKREIEWERIKENNERWYSKVNQWKLTFITSSLTDERTTSKNGSLGRVKTEAKHCCVFYCNTWIRKTEMKLNPNKGRQKSKIKWFLSVNSKIINIHVVWSLAKQYSSMFIVVCIDLRKSWYA